MLYFFYSINKMHSKSNYHIIFIVLSIISISSICSTKLSFNKMERKNLTNITQYQLSNNTENSTKFENNSKINGLRFFDEEIDQLENSTDFFYNLTLLKEQNITTPDYNRKNFTEMISNHQDHNVMRTLHSQVENNIIKTQNFNKENFVNFELNNEATTNNRAKIDERRATNKYISMFNKEKVEIENSPIDYNEFSEAIMNTSTVTVLSLSNINNIQLEYISNALKNNNSIVRLNLHSNQIGPLGAKLICDALKINKSITQLSFYDNNLGSKGAKYIADMLEVNKYIIELNLYGNQIQDEGAQYLSQSLQVNKSIRRLYLSSNQIGNNGLFYLSQALKNNNSLEILYLHNNQISNAGAASILDALNSK